MVETATNAAALTADMSNSQLSDLDHVSLLTAQAGAAKVINLAALGAQGFSINGERPDDQAGWSVASAGDVNGDGLDDVVIGSLAKDDDNYRSGKAYVIFGESGATRGSINLTTLSSENGFAITGKGGQHGEAGFSVASAGDVDGDGVDDLIIGTGSAEEAYLIFGKTGSRPEINLSMLTVTDGFTIRSGKNLATRTGQSVAAAGDINGDGYSDLLIGASFESVSGQNDGAAYLLFGKARANLNDIDLAMLTPAQGFRVQGEVNSQAGESVASAGDVNGDGLDDFVVGAPTSNSAAGRSYVIYGRLGSTGENLDLTTLLPSQGFIVSGAPGDYSGASVASAGDLNGDGFADLIVGAPGGIGGGKAYVVFGHAGATRPQINFSLLSAGGELSPGGTDSVGASVASAGDFDGDGFDDFIVSAPGLDDGGQDAGGAYLIYGSSSTASRQIDLSKLSVDQALVLLGEHPDHKAGISVSSAGDINGDGFADLIIGEPYGEAVGTTPGTAYVIFGRSRHGPFVSQAISNQTTSPHQDFHFTLPSLTFQDPDFDPLTLSASLADGSALPSWLYFDPNLATFAGSPPGDFAGHLDIKVVASDGTTTASDNFTITVVAVPEWRLFASDGFASEIGGSGAVVGTYGLQDITALNLAGAITFDPSFNRGGDIVRLSGDSNRWTALRSGSSAVLSDGDTVLLIPVGSQGLSIIFQDGVRSLHYDSTSGSIMLGAQSLDSQAVTITAKSDGSVISFGTLPAAEGRLFLNDDAQVSVSGKLEIFGTVGAQQISLFHGQAVLDPSFNRGGDTLSFDEKSSAFNAERVGSSVHLSSVSGTEITVPVGTIGMTLDFDGAHRELYYDMTQGVILLSGQVISADATTLIA